MIEIEHGKDYRFITVRAAGTLTAKEYDAALPELQHAMELAEDRLRVLVRLEDFHGWEMEALWKEIKFDVAHGRELGRVAVVGENRWEEWVTTLSAPFFGTDVRYFPHDREDEARKWLEA